MVENVKEAVAEGLKEFFKSQLRPRFDQIDQKFEGVDRQLSVMHGKLPDHERQLSSIHEKQEEHDEKFRDVLAHFDELYQRLTRLEDECPMPLSMACAYCRVLPAAKRRSVPPSSGGEPRSVGPSSVPAIMPSDVRIASWGYCHLRLLRDFNSVSVVEVNPCWFRGRRLCD